MRQRILVVEDDRGVAKVLCDNLELDGFEVKWATNAPEALAASGSFRPDLVLLDLMLPGRSGFELCGALRQGSRMPIIIVSARSQRGDKLKGLGLGADDYVTKPFDMEELVARVRAVLRRSTTVADRIVLGRITIDFSTMSATGPMGAVHLTHREFEILRYLANHKDAVVHRDRLLADVWGVLDGSTTRSVDYAIVRLRRKIEPDPHHPILIRTVHGDGYCLTFDVPGKPT